MMFKLWLSRLRRLVGVPRRTAVLTARIDNARDDLLRIIDALHHIAAAEDARAHQLRTTARQARSKVPEGYELDMPPADGARYRGAPYRPGGSPIGYDGGNAGQSY